MIKSIWIKYFNRCWLLYAAGALLLYAGLNRKSFDLQYLNSYRSAAAALMQCVPFSCTEGGLKDGLVYYLHWADYFPNSMEANMAVGYSYYHLHAYPRALKYINRAISIDPQNAALFFNQAMVLCRMKDGAGAYAALKKGEPFLAGGSFLRPNLIIPLKNGGQLHDADQLPVLFNWMRYQYWDLMATLEPGHSAADLDAKLNGLDLYYYLPMVKAEVHGQQVNMI